MKQAFYKHNPDLDWRCARPLDDVMDFHRSLEGYQPTPLIELTGLAEELRVARVFAKDESLRLGLPAFKSLGASWAVNQVLSRNPSPEKPTIVTATDGNHGRAIARFSRLSGAKSLVVVPRGLHPKAVQAIANEGALVEEFDGNYDQALARAAEIANQPGYVLIQDTAWKGYEAIPSLIVEGYETLFAEIDEQLGALGLSQPNLVAIPTGVGSLLQSALRHYRWGTSSARTAVISVEPDVASCIAPSLSAGQPVTVKTGSTILSGLNCGTPSVLAWPYIQNGLDAAVSISDEEAIVATRDLLSLGIDSGPCGGAGLAGLRIAVNSDDSVLRRNQLGIGESSVLVFIITEGTAANPFEI